MKRFRQLINKTIQDILNNHTMSLAAGLSYYFVMSLFPLLILLAAIVSYLPIPNLFDRVVDAMSSIVPASSMGLVRAIVHDVITPSRGSFLTLGIVGTVWSASGGFAALIEALNVAYDVREARPFWKSRLIALGLMVIVGLLLVCAVFVVFVGPQFGYWLTDKVGLSGVFASLWPFIRWSVAIGFTVLAVELIFYWAPNVCQRSFLLTLPGAVLAVAFWIGASYGLGLYFQNFTHFNKTYGTLGGAIALMVWLYWSWFMILVAAHINAAILLVFRGEKAQPKEILEDQKDRQLPLEWKRKEVA